VLVLEEVAGDAGVVLAAGLETGDGEAAATGAGLLAGVAAVVTVVSIEGKSSTLAQLVSFPLVLARRSRPLAVVPDSPELAS
jgi:hypothetical protein